MCLFARRICGEAVGVSDLRHESQVDGQKGSHVSWREERTGDTRSRPLQRGEEVSLGGVLHQELPAPRHVDAEGRFSVERKLQAGDNELHIVARDPQGYSRILRLDVLVNDRDAEGNRITVEQAVPNLTLRLPPEGMRLRTPVLPLVGKADPGNRIRVNGAELDVRSDGSFSGEIELLRPLLPPMVIWSPWLRAAFSIGWPLR